MGPQHVAPLSPDKIMMMIMIIIMISKNNDNELHVGPAHVMLLSHHPSAEMKS